MATLQTIGPNVLAGPLNANFAALNNDKMEKTANSDLNMNNKNITNIAAATLGNFQDVVISGGAITVNKAHHRIDTSGGPGELSTINGGSDGQLLLLRATSSLRPITIKHGVGNIATNDSQDVVLNNSNNSCLLFCASNSWYVIGNVGVRRDGDLVTGQVTIRRSNTYSHLRLERIDAQEGAAVIGITQDNVIVYDTAGNRKLTINVTDGSLTLNDKARIMPGTGSPEGVVAAPVGSVYLRTDGGANTTLYVKQSGNGNTGWAAK